MDIPALEAAVRTLEHSIGVFTWCLLGSTFVVSLGLILEYWHPVSEFIDELKWPMSVFRWPKFMEIAGGILVTIGVLGEFGFTLEVFVLEGQLEQANHSIRDALTAKLGEAGQKAKTAISDSSIALSQAKDALSQARAATGASSVAQRKANEARMEADDVRQRYLLAEAEVSKEHTARMELEHAVAPRWIWNMAVDGKSNLEPLAKYKGKSVRFETISDFEARRAAHNLQQIFLAAGWTLSNPKIVIIDPEDVDDSLEGVIVEHFENSEPTWPEVNKKWDAAEIADAVVGFLQSNGWKARPSWSPPGELKANEIKIRIGFKPTQYFEPEILKRLQKEIEERIEQKRMNPQKPPQK